MRSPVPEVREQDPMYKTTRARLIAAAGLAVAFIACADGTPTSPETRTLGVPGHPSGLYVSDPSLDYSDTWVSATQTITDTTRFTSSSVPVLDPATGQQTNSITVGSDPQTVQVLGGYGYDGQIRITTSYDAANPVETATVRQVGDATADFSQNGDANYDALDQEPTSVLGTLQYAQIDVSAGSGGSGGSCVQGTCVAAMQRNVQGASAAAVSASAPSTATRTVLLDATHLRVTQMMPIDLPDPRVPAMQADAGSDKSEKREAKQIRDYEKHGNDWVLKHIRQESSASDGDRETSHVQEIEFMNVQFFSNKKKDKERRDARDKLLASLPAQVTTSALTPGGFRPMLACDDPCGGGTPGGGTPAGSTPYAYEPRVDEIAQIASDATVGSSVGQTTVVLQHGFVSSSDTWRPMQDWLSHDLAAAITRKTLNWRDTYENQAGVLSSRLNTENYIPYRSPVILVGHSNGGMISRYLARNPGVLNVTSVVTVGTPHKGVPAARYLRSLVVIFGWGPYPAAAICPVLGMAGCTRFGQLVTEPVSAYWRSLWNPIPVLNEMQPNSAYHAAFNAQPETFNRYGIESYIWQHWQIWKQNGDMKCFPEESCGGYKEVKKTDRIYHHDLSCSVVGFFTLNWSKAFMCGLDAGFLKAIDGTYNKYTRDGDTDGIVPKASQLYPNIPTDHQYEIYDGPSHTGETKAIVVRDRLETVLRRLGLPNRL